MYTVIGGKLHDYHVMYFIGRRATKISLQVFQLLWRISVMIRLQMMYLSRKSFLLVLQTPKQQQWLIKYGNTITCMDAIYKTTKYGFPCFFLVVKTSLGIGRVAATIIPQYETTEMIKEGLQILKLWNPQWKPKFFMTDKSSQELEAVAAVHPTCIRYICDIHRGQAFERWVNQAANGVTPTTRNLVLDSMKHLAYAPTGKYHNNHYTHLHRRPHTVRWTLSSNSGWDQGAALVH